MKEMNEFKTSGIPHQACRATRRSPRVTTPTEQTQGAAPRGKNQAMLLLMRRLLMRLLLLPTAAIVALTKEMEQVLR